MFLPFPGGSSTLPLEENFKSRGPSIWLYLKRKEVQKGASVFAAFQESDAPIPAAGGS